MTEPITSNPYRYLITLSRSDASEGSGIAKLIEEVIQKSDPPFLPTFLARTPHYPMIKIAKEVWDKGEKILRMFWRGDYSFEVVPGPYRHFKGGLYTVEKEGLLLEGPKEEIAVIYSAVGDPSKTFIRPLREWVDVMEWPDGEYRPRFKREH